MLLKFYLLLSMLAGSPETREAAPPTATAIVDTAIARMGGRAALEGVRTAQYEIMTQWISLVPTDQPFAPSPSYERQTDYRDYATKTWRNIRRFPRADLTWMEWVDLVADTVPARRVIANLTPSVGVATPALPIDGWAPLNIAYVEERRALFAWTPERLLLNMRAAPDIRLARDTSIGGVTHYAVSGTINTLPFTVFIHGPTMLPRFARYRADESNDFGLAPWGMMEVEIWYSRWAPHQQTGLLIPRQWDTRRVGMPYKRMSVINLSYNSVVAPDSLVVADSVRRVYLAIARRPMGDRPIDSLRIAVPGRAVEFFGAGAPSAAVRLGTEWMLVDGGNLPMNAERAIQKLSDLPDTLARSATAAVVTTARPTGVAAWAAETGKCVYVGSASAAPTKTIAKNRGNAKSCVNVVSAGRWVRASKTVRDSLWMEPVELLNGAGMLLYSPSESWAYSGAISAPSDVSTVARTLQGRGWKVSRVAGPGRLAGVAVDSTGTPVRPSSP